MYIINNATSSDMNKKKKEKKVRKGPRGHLFKDNNEWISSVDTVDYSEAIWHQR